MQGLAIIAALIACGYGFGAGGILGALTGLIVAIGLGSGLAIASAEPRTGVALTGSTRNAQRIGGILTTIGCLVGAYYGGWEFGWMWAIVGYLAGTVSVLLVNALIGKLEPTNPVPNHQSIGRDSIPSYFDLEDIRHVSIIDEIRDKFSTLLASDSSPYSQCMYRPSSLLPYPKDVIKSALEALLDYVEDRRSSRFLNVNFRTPETADTIRTSLLLLDNFLDVPAEKLPSDPRENLRVGFDLQQS